MSTADIQLDQKLSNALMNLMQSGTKAYVLLDETQEISMQGSALIHLTKKAMGHSVTVIGAGISKADCISSRFGYTFTTDGLFFSAQQLEDQGCFAFFCSNAPENKHEEIIALVKMVREYVGRFIP